MDVCLEIRAEMGYVSQQGQRVLNANAQLVMMELVVLVFISLFLFLFLFYFIYLFPSTVLS